MAKTKRHVPGKWRHFVVSILFMSAFVVVGARAAYLQVFSADYLQRQGDARYLRTVQDNAIRGMIMDRNGTPLAISTPVESVWVDPSTFTQQSRPHWKKIANVLDLRVSDISSMLASHRNREFMYLKRHITPETARAVSALEVPGLYLQREYRRYYPMGSVFGHVIGFTNIDDEGQEGIELVYEPLLKATPGRKRVLKDRLGRVVETVESQSLPVPGADMRLSLDKRIQYLAYRELKNAMLQHNARAASAVVLDARSGEVLAMVNEPGFNPNNRHERKSRLFRNRAVTDVLEPGSTLKPFTVAAGLESGQFRPDSTIDTSPGTYQVGSKTIRDARDYGRLTVAGVIKKSSNVGATKIALASGKQTLWKILNGVGFGHVTGSGLPGEVGGVLRPADRWVPVDHAAMSFGYGVSVTPLQLARAYSVLANNGDLTPLSMVPQSGKIPRMPVMSPRNARKILNMLELAVSDEGTGNAAQLRYYRVAGKTGTVHKLMNGQYAEDRYVALFAGVAPASDPRLVMVVTVDDPKNGGHFGGQIAAPVFSRVMGGAMRLLNISPDAWEPAKPRTFEAMNRGSGNG